MQRSAIATRMATYDFRIFGNDFRKNGNKKKRDLCLAINPTQIVVIPPCAFVPRGVNLDTIVEPCLLDKLRYPVIINIFKFFHTTNVEYGCQACNSRRHFDLYTIYNYPE